MGGDESTAGGERNTNALSPESDVGRDVPAGVTHMDQPTEARPLAELPLDSLLLPVVRTRIVPRLLVNLGPASFDSSRKRFSPCDELIDELANHLLEPDIAAARHCVEQVQAEDSNLGLAVLDLFAHVARELGRRWDVDEASFADVTIAMSHLSALLRYSSNLSQTAVQTRGSVCMMMAALPGDQHSFGLTVAAEHFTRVGFDVRIFDDASGQGMLDRLSSQAYDIVGLSLGDLRHQHALADLIVQIRTASLNRDVGIIVGGPHFAANPALGQSVGADLIVDNLHVGTADVLALVDWLRSSCAVE